MRTARSLAYWQSDRADCGWWVSAWYMNDASGNLWVIAWELEQQGADADFVQNVRDMAQAFGDTQQAIYAMLQ